MLKKYGQTAFLPWLVWGISAAYVLYQFLLQSSISVMIPALMKDLHIDVLDIGILSSSFFYFYVILQIPAGILVDRFGARILLLISMSLCGLSALIFANANTMNVAEWSRILMGIASSPAVVCGMYLASRWFDKDKFALIAGMVEMIGILGGAVGQICLAHLATAWGWRAAMGCCVVIVLLLLLLCTFFVKNHCPTKQNLACEKIATPVLVKKFLKVILMPQVWVACIYSGLMFSIITGFAGLWSIPFLQAGYGITANKASGISALVFFGAAFGTSLIGWLACRLGKLKIIMTFSAVLAFLVMMLILFIKMPILLMCVAFIILGLCSGAYVLAFALVKKVTDPKISATAMGFTNMVCIVLGAPVLQPLIGWILQESLKTPVNLTLIDYQHALIPLPAFLALAILIGLFIRDRSCVE